MGSTTWKESGCLNYISVERRPAYRSGRWSDAGFFSDLFIVGIRASARTGAVMAKKEITLREHLQRIQRKGGKARWEGVPAEERSEQARKSVTARWTKAKKDAAVKATPQRAAAKNAKTKKSS